MLLRESQQNFRRDVMERRVQLRRARAARYVEEISGRLRRDVGVPILSRGIVCQPRQKGLRGGTYASTHSHRVNECGSGSLTAESRGSLDGAILSFGGNIRLQERL